MSKIGDSISDLHVADNLVRRQTFLTSVHPTVLLLVIVWYMLAAVSFSKYDLTGVLSMFLILVILVEVGEIPFRFLFGQLKMLFLLLLLVGIANPILDREVLTRWGEIPITGGMVSFVTLYMKGVCTLAASYILIASTGMEQVCYALQTLRMPRILTTVLMLIYRYMILFLKEADRITLAYSMRAPRQKGIHIRAWGSLLGTMLLRSIDRAQTVYESMELRGFTGEYRIKGAESIRRGRSIVFGITMAAGILFLRIVPVFELIGGL